MIVPLTLADPFVTLQFLKLFLTTFRLFTLPLFLVSEASSRLVVLSLVEHLQTAGVAVIAADLAVRLVQIGGVGESGWDGMGVWCGDGVSRGRGQGAGVAVGNGEGRRAVVLVSNGGGSSSGAQGLSLRQLVPQLRHTLLFLWEQRGRNVKSYMFSVVK